MMFRTTRQAAVLRLDSLLFMMYVSNNYKHEHLDQIKSKELERPLVAVCSITDLKVISEKFWWFKCLRKRKNTKTTFYVYCVFTALVKSSFMKTMFRSFPSMLSGSARPAT